MTRDKSSKSTGEVGILWQTYYLKNITRLYNKVHVSIYCAEKLPKGRIIQERILFY